MDEIMPTVCFLSSSQCENIEFAKLLSIKNKLGNVNESHKDGSTLIGKSFINLSFYVSSFRPFLNSVYQDELNLNSCM